MKIMIPNTVIKTAVDGALVGFVVIFWPVIKDFTFNIPNLQNAAQNVTLNIID